MTALCAWLSEMPAAAAGRVAAAMGRALRVHAGQAWSLWTFPGLALGLLDLPGGEEEAGGAPAVSADGRFHLFLVGEVFDTGRLPLSVDAPASRTLAFRRWLLAALLEQGVEAAASLDGEHWLALWDARERRLALTNDRFGSLPLYWARAKEGLAVAGGVRGVLAAPGVAAEPDPQALCEAVSFGGYRLGDRTQVEGVRMFPGATLARLEGSDLRLARWAAWRDLPARQPAPRAERIETADALWRQAIARRLTGAESPGQTLSGGLDSRAILAEAAPHAPRWTAITYGVPGCDDARYAERAARAAGAHWRFVPLYGDGWLARRTGFIQETDGLIQLGDLQHLESLDLQRETLDLHLSGYIGDAVAGPTFNDLAGAADILAALPYYGGRLALPWNEALAKAEELLAGLGGAPARFALFDHKLPQSTNRWTAAYRPYFRVRRPFTDRALFDFFQGLPPAVRGEEKLYERWLAARHPALFAKIPNQKTGLPILASPARIQLARARRFAWRKLQPRLAALGLPTRPRIRAFTADEAMWSAPEARAEIEGTILRPGSIAAEIFGRNAVTAVLDDWFTRGAAPAQVVGALYVWEAYHRDLAGFLRERREEG